jgi:hypothetical protein
VPEAVHRQTHAITNCIHLTALPYPFPLATHFYQYLPPLCLGGVQISHHLSSPAQGLPNPAAGNPAGRAPQRWRPAPGVGSSSQVIPSWHPTSGTNPTQACSCYVSSLLLRVAICIGPIAWPQPTALYMVCPDAAVTPTSKCRVSYVLPVCASGQGTRYVSSW